MRQFPGAVGIPVHHPPVEAFLGVPLFSKGKVVGELLVANRVDQINMRRRAAMASIAHDLRTPVAAVWGFAELAADPRLPESKRLTILQRLETQPSCSSG